jgi:hypothetical protein
LVLTCSPSWRYFLPRYVSLSPFSLHPSPRPSVLTQFPFHVIVAGSSRARTGPSGNTSSELNGVADWRAAIVSFTCRTRFHRTPTCLSKSYSRLSQQLHSLKTPPIPTSNIVALEIRPRVVSPGHGHSRAGPVPLGTVMRGLNLPGGRSPAWNPTTMSTSTTASRGSPVFQHLSATKKFLHDATIDARYAWGGLLSGVSGLKLEITRPRLRSTKLRSDEPTNRIESGDRD